MKTPLRWTKIHALSGFGYSQKAIAAALDVSRTTVSHVLGDLRSAAEQYDSVEDCLADVYGTEEIDLGDGVDLDAAAEAREEAGEDSD